VFELSRMTVAGATRLLALGAIDRTPAPIDSVAAELSRDKAASDYPAKRLDSTCLVLWKELTEPPKECPQVQPNGQYLHALIDQSCS